MTKRWIFFLALISLTTFSQAQLEVLGLRTDPTSGLFSCLKWNTQSMAVTDSIVTTENGVYSGSSTFDAFTGSYYFRSTTGLNRIDFNPDSFINVNQLTPSGSTEVDMATGGIFEVAYEQVYDSLGNLLSVNLNLVRFDFAAGTDAVIGALPNIWGVLMDASAFNSNTGDYYVVVVDSSSNYQIARMSTRGAFSYSFLPITNPNIVMMGLEYDNEYNLLYGMALNLNGGNMVDLYRIDPVTGNLSLEIPLPGIVGIVSTTMSFHQATSTYLFVGIDTANNYHLYQCNTVYDTISYGLLPGMNVIEIEADNSIFAFNKYLATGIQAPQAAALRVYPNPATDIVRIDVADLVNLRVYDTQGRLIVEHSGSKLAQIEVATWTPGIYFLQGRALDGKVIGAKFIKK